MKTQCCDNRCAIFNFFKSIFRKYINWNILLTITRHWLILLFRIKPVAFKLYFLSIWNVIKIIIVFCCYFNFVNNFRLKCNDCNSTEFFLKVADNKDTKFTMYIISVDISFDNCDWYQFCVGLSFTLMWEWNWKTSRIEKEQEKRTSIKITRRDSRMISFQMKTHVTNGRYT